MNHCIHRNIEYFGTPSRREHAFEGAYQESRDRFDLI
jgi:hypothetical protein